MAQWRKPAAVYLCIVAAAIAFWFVFSPLLGEWFGDSLDIGAGWAVIDPLAIIGAVIALIYTWRRKMDDESGAEMIVTRDWLAHTAAFFVIAFLFILLLGNFVLDTILSADLSANRGLVWITIDAGLPLAFLAVATMMWRQED